MRLSHNMFSMGIYKNYKSTLQVNSKALNNISTGVKINSSKDNPNKIAQSENLKLQVLSRQAAQDNIQDTNSMIQTFDGSMQQMNNQLSRLKELTVKASTDTNDDDDRAVIQKEIDGILSNLNDLAKNTQFNSVNMSVKEGGAEDKITSTIGSMGGETISLTIHDLTTDGLGLTDKSDSSKNINVSTKEGADKAMSMVDNAIKKVSKVRGEYGAIQSRLEDTYSSMNEITDTLESAQSNIADADVAEEMLNYARTNIMYQSSISLMAQSNKFPQDALNVLASVK